MESYWSNSPEYLNIEKLKKRFNLVVQGHISELVNKASKDIRPSQQANTKAYSTEAKNGVWDSTAWAKKFQLCYLLVI